jgi:hypothetical protein
MQQLVTQVLLPLILALVMLGIGMALQPADFRRVLLKPKASVLGLCAFTSNVKAPDPKKANNNPGLPERGDWLN